MASLRIGSLRDEARPVGRTGYDREARKLLRAGYSDAAGKLALAASQDQLENGNIQSSENRIERRDAAYRLNERAKADELRKAMAAEKKIDEFVSSEEKPDATQAKPAAAGKTDELATKRAGEKERIAALRSAYEKVVNPSGKKEAGNMTDVQRMKPLVGPPDPADSISGTLDSVRQSRADIANELRKSFARPMAVGGKRVPQYESYPRAVLLRKAESQRNL